MGNYSAITDPVAAYLQAALPHSGLKGWSIRDDSEVGDFSCDDSLVLIAPDGTKSSVYVQCGPYGIGVNREIYNEQGEFDAVEHQPFRQMASHLLLNDLQKALKAAAADAPGLSPRM